MIVFRTLINILRSVTMDSMLLQKAFNTKNKRTIIIDCPFNYARRDSNSRPFGS